MKKNISEYLIIVLTLTSALFSWLSVERAITIPEASSWVIPMICFSILGVALSLMSVFIRSAIITELTVGVSFLLSLFFAFSLWHFFIIILCILIMISGVQRIRRDMDLNIKISLWKSLNIGKARIIFSLALLISSQYFFIAKEMDGQKIIPKFDLSGASAKLVGPMLGMISPDFKKIENEDLTVDQFIIKSQEDRGGDFISGEMIDAQIPKNLPSPQREVLKKEALQNISSVQEDILQKNNEFVLKEGRRQLSEMIGQELVGSEKVSDIFAGLINKKINDYSNPELQGKGKSSLLPFIFAVILFLTIAPMGSVLGNLWFGVVIVIFHLFLNFGIVSVEKEMVEREKIA